MSCADDASLVMRVARGGASLLLTGDATASAERAVLAAGGDAGNPAAALLLAADHGGAEGTPAFWLDAVEPEAVLASCGPHAKERHPDGEFLALLEERGLPLLRTDLDGDLHVEFLPGVPLWPKQGWRIWCRNKPGSVTDGEVSGGL